MLIILRPASAERAPDGVCQSADRDICAIARQVGPACRVLNLTLWEAPHP